MGPFFFSFVASLACGRVTWELVPGGHSAQELFGSVSDACRLTARHIQSLTMKQNLEIGPLPPSAHGQTICGCLATLPFAPLPAARHLRHGTHAKTGPVSKPSGIWGPPRGTRLHQDHHSTASYWWPQTGRSWRSLGKGPLSRLASWGVLIFFGLIASGLQHHQI